MDPPDKLWLDESGGLFCQVEYLSPEQMGFVFAVHSSVY